MSWPYDFDYNFDYDYDYDHDYCYDDYDDSNTSDRYDDSDDYDSDYGYVRRENKKTYDEDDTCRFENTIYCRELLAELNSQRHAKDFIDLVVKVQERRFRCHRAVLASTPIFKTMLSSNLAERKSKVVELHGIDSKSFSKILDFLYTGEICISKDDVQDILQAAHMLQIDKITEYCREFIEDNLCLSNCLGVMRLADVYEFSDLIEDARKEALSNFLKLGQNEEFLTLTGEELLDLLKDEELCVTDEEDIVAAVMRWVDHDPENRRTATVAIFQEIRLMSVRVSMLKKLELHPVIQDSPECLAVVRGAKEKHLAGATLQQISAKAKMNEAEIRQRLGTSDDLAIFVGGWRIDEGSPRDANALTIPLQSVMCLDPDSEQCYHITNLPSPVSGYMSVARVGRRLYVTGGRAHPLIGEQGPHSAPSRQAFRYDFFTDTWTALPDMPRSRAGHQSVIVDEKLFLVGGDTDDTPGFTMDCYDLEVEAWIVPPTLPEIASLDFTVTACESKILLVELFDNTAEEVRNWEDRTKLRVHSFDVKTAHWLYTDISAQCMYSSQNECKLVTVVNGNVHILLNSTRVYSPQMFLYHVEQASLSKLEDTGPLSVSFWGTQYMYQQQYTIHQENLTDVIICCKFDEDNDNISSSMESDIKRTWDLNFALFGHSFLAANKSSIGWYCRDLDKLERDEAASLCRPVWCIPIV